MSSAGRRDDDTWSGAALADLARKVGARSFALPPIARAFLGASLRRERGRRRRRWLPGGLLARAPWRTLSPAPRRA